MCLFLILCLSGFISVPMCTLLLQYCIGQGWIHHEPLVVRCSTSTSLFLIDTQIGINTVTIVVYFFNRKNYFTVWYISRLCKNMIAQEFLEKIPYKYHKNTKLVILIKYYQDDTYHQHHQSPSIFDGIHLLVWKWRNM